MATHGEYDWLAIRRDHAKGMTVSAIARKYKVRRATVQERKAAEGWTYKNVQAAESEAAKTAREAEVAARPAKVAAVTTVAELKSEVLKAMLETVKAFNKNEIHPGDKQSKADVYDKVVGGTGRGVSLLKDIDGLAPTMPLDTEQADEDPGKLYEVAIKPAQSA